MASSTCRSPVPADSKAPRGFLFAWLMAGIFGCGSSDDVGGPEAGRVASDLGGVLSEDVHLGAGDGFHRVESDLLIPGGITLSASAGAELRIARGASIIVHGTLSFLGSPGDSVLVWSLEDSPEPGDWAGIVIDSTGARADIEFTRILHAERGISVEGGGTARVDSSAVSWAGDTGIWVGSGWARVRGTEFSDLPVGARSDAGRLCVEGGRFLRFASVGFVSDGGVDSVSHAEFAQSRADGIRIDGSLVGRVVSNRISVGSVGIELRNAPQRVSVDSNYVEGGRTSLRVHGARASRAMGNTFTGAGRWAIECFGSDIAIEANVIDSCGSGIRVASGATPTITGNTLTGQAAYGVRIEDGDPWIEQNAITGNGTYGIWTPDWVHVVNARDNWWGDVTGPREDFGNPGGQGDRVTRWVGYAPWATAPPPGS